MTALDAKRRLFLARATRFCGSASAALAAGSIVGWIIRWPALENLFIGINPVHALLAAGIVLVGAALYRCVPECRRSCKPLAGAAFAVAAYTLAEYAVGRDFSIDRWLPADTTLINPRLPGHMTLLSAIVLALVSQAVLSLDIAWKGRRPSNLLAGLAWALSLMGLVNHLYGASLLTGGLDMALPSSLIFILLASGVLTARPGLVTRLMLDSGAGGEVARRFFPAAVFVPIFLGWLRIALERHFTTAHTATAALVVAICAVFAFLVVRLARRIEDTSRELHETRLHFETAVANIKEYAIFLLDVEGRVASWNAGAQALKGWAAEEIVGRHFSAFFPPEATASGRPDRELEIARRDGRYQEEGWRVRKDGARFWASVVITPVLDESGGLTGFIKVTRDMTGRRRAEEELRKAVEALKSSNQELESFAYVASHDLQEPLRKVTSFTQLLAQRYSGKIDETGDRYIGYIVDGAQRMQRLISDLLAYSRLGGASAPAPTDLAAVAKSAWNDLAVAVRESKARLDLGELPTVNADPRRMLQLFENLLANAVKFRKKDQAPVVRVWADKEEGRRVIPVADNGIGLEPRYRDQIFEMFRRLHPQSEYPGTGIGLSICKRVVEQLGGEIWVESEPGKGSTFRFTIPEAEVR